MEEWDFTLLLFKDEIWLARMVQSLKTCYITYTLGVYVAGHNSLPTVFGVVCSDTSTLTLCKHVNNNHEKVLRRKEEMLTYIYLFKVT